MSFNFQLSTVRFYLVAVILVSLFFSCNSTKHVPQNKYLLKSYSIDSDSKKITAEEFDMYIKQRPNKKMLMLYPFHLSVYNLFYSEKAYLRQQKKVAEKHRAKLSKISKIQNASKRIKKEKKENRKHEKRKKRKAWNNWIATTIGEAPVIYEEIYTKKTLSAIESYLKNKGYYYYEVDSFLQFSKKKCSVVYKIRTGEPYIIRTVKYEIYDENIQDIVVNNLKNRMLRPFTPFDVSRFQQERDKITKLLKNRGYYAFQKEYIHFEADTLPNSREVDITLIIDQPKYEKSKANFLDENHRKYKIASIQIFTYFDLKEYLKNKEGYRASFDSTVYNGVVFYHKKKFKIKPKVIYEYLYIKQGEGYKQELVEKTQEQLGGLKLFKLIDINFSELPDTTAALLDCQILLKPHTIQSYTIELEGSNSSGNFGAGTNFSYGNKNIFRGAEIFNFKFKGAFERQTNSSANSFNTFEAGVEGNLDLPGFIFPRKSDLFKEFYIPRTRFTLAVNRKKRPDYTKNVSNFTLSYIWKTSEFFTHTIAPIDFSNVTIPEIDPDFFNSIQSLDRKSTYEDHLISISRYSLLFNNQNIKRPKDDHFYIRTDIESAGNILSAINRISKPTEESYYTFLSKRYAQYVKANVDFRFYHRINNSRNLVYRAYFGAAYPFGNFDVLPVSKKYFSGGANGIRAWAVKGLGPGVYVMNEQDKQYLNQLGDIKLELNLEYRFHLFWVLEGALFLDAGNIWAINSNDEREGALFQFDSFYKQLALGTGFGTRFDFSFFILRFDFGLKMHDPSLLGEKAWVVFNQPFKINHFTFNFGIGYPF